MLWNIGRNGVLWIRPGYRRELDCSSKRQLVVVEQRSRIQRTAAVAKEMLRARTDEKYSVLEVGGRADVVPVHVAEDDVVYVFWVEKRFVIAHGGCCGCTERVTSIAKTCCTVGVGDDGLPLGDVVLLGLGVACDIAFDAEVEEDVGG